VCTLITVQSTAGLVSVTALDPAVIEAQARELLAHQRVRAIKTGALGSAACVRLVCQLVREHPQLPVVIDPVMVATRAPTGAKLLDPEALQAMREALSLATVATPNLDEAEALLGERLSTVEDLEAAATELQHRFGAKAVLVKGGHLSGGLSVDVLALAGRVVRLGARRYGGPPFHGGGCALAALIAGRLGRAVDPLSQGGIIEAVGFAKRKLGHAIAAATEIGDGLLVLPMGATARS